jgi:thiamine biosynthesis lipoprotein
MGIMASFSVIDGPPSSRGTLEAACAELHRIDELFSPWRPESAVSRLRCGELGQGELPQELSEVLDRCREAREITVGWFDPWAMPGGVDPSGLVKGWAVERAGRILREGGVRCALINGGGDIACFGSPPGAGPWRIGIRHPWRDEALAAIIECDGGGVATSGTYERGEHLGRRHRASSASRHSRGNRHRRGSDHRPGLAGTTARARPPRSGSSRWAGARTGRAAGRARLGRPSRWRSASCQGR